MQTRDMVLRQTFILHLLSVRQVVQNTFKIKPIKNHILRMSSVCKFPSMHPSLKSYQIRFFDPSGDILAEVQLDLNKTFKHMVPTSDLENPYTKVSCLFIKHLLTSGFITVDGTEKLCQPKRREFIAGHSISSTFFCTSAVCLLISQNVNKKLIGIDRNFQMDIFWTKTPKNHFLRIKLLTKIIF